MVRIGLVGVGFMGRIHYLAAARVPGAKVAAVCSRDAAKLGGDWRATRGNFGPEPGQVDLTGVKTYAAFADLLADPTIDLIDICTVTDQHAPMALAALRAGKHVLVEKAIALTTADADAMLDAARKAGRLLMVAHVLPFFPEFRFASEAVRSGEFGKLLGGHLTRVISRPDWSGDIGDAAKTGGPAVDLHIHDTHFVGLIAGVPERVSSVGVVGAGGAVEYLTTSYLYGAGGPALTCSSGALAMAGRPFVHGFELYLERATLTYSSGGPALTVLTKDGSHKPTLPAGDEIDTFAAEITAAAEAVRSGVEPALLSGQLARDALALCHLEIESVRTGLPVATR